MEQPTPPWLTEIQDRSWEPELFISGGAIFFLWQVTGFLQYESFILTQQTGYYEPLVIANFLIAALNALIVGFAVHLIMRGFWVAAVTLSYVFPKGIQNHRIHYAEVFKDKIEHVKSTVEQVVVLETICSIIFTLSFFFFLIIMGVLVTLLVIIPHSALDEIIGESGLMYLRILLALIYVLAFIYLIDFFTLGYIKKQKRWAKVYYPIYYIFSWLTLAPLYRTTYYTLVSNIRPWILILGAIVYITIAFTITQLRLEGTKAFFNLSSYLNLSSEEHIVQSRFYENMRKPGSLVQHMTIQSEIISDNYLRLFIVHQKIIEKMMSRGCGEMNMQSQEYLNCYSDFYKVFINDTLQTSLKWRQYQHPETREQGILTYMSISQLPTQEHILKVVLNVSQPSDLEKLSKFGLRGATYAYIPFWKD